MMEIEGKKERSEKIIFYSATEIETEIEIEILKNIKQKFLFLITFIF